ncbi:MAG: TIGR03960 family B12-binding radical SAM protein [Elusimicrobia bacterium]|nr:TIGR03960 family B12-binding radical SAM protein [Candidatus Liberimonas magnetica]
MNIDLDKILPLVQRPGRYIDHEYNASRKKEGEVKVCLCFPDLYELGASNLGLEILYNIINKMEGALAERCYSVAEDLEKELKKNNLPLFSLESKTPLAEFDIIGFTLQYELCATNVLNMLELSGIPFLSKDRDKTYPLIIGGGPVTANPEPVADFFDAFVIGDGEEAIQDIIVKVQIAKCKLQNKSELLLELAKIPGVYVPSFYNVEYKEDGGIKSFKPISDAIPEKIEKRVVKLEESIYPDKPIVPYLQTVHDRLNIEIARGCTQRCKFCQASRYYWPYRIRSKEKVLKLIEQGIRNTGYEEVSLSSLSCTEYKDIKELLLGINNLYKAKKLSISLPSLRCDLFSLEVASNLGSGKKPNLTFAPEAGSDRLRNVIGKGLSETKIVDTLVLASNMGWHLIKLYFMIGLPTEKYEDIEAIVALVKKLHQKTGKMNFNVTISPFVPKPHTSFQWTGMADEDVLSNSLKKLMKELPASVKQASIKSSKLEAVFARGDRRLANVITTAYKKGCKFDQWKDKLRIEIWEEAFKEESIDPDYYMSRNFIFEDILPWDHLAISDKESLWKDYEESLSAGSSFPVEDSSVNPVNIRPHSLKTRPDIFSKKPLLRLQLRFSRKGEVRFLSHLEQIEFFRRMLRRADVPLVNTSGFHPQPKISFGPAISVGYESLSEYLEMELYEKVEQGELKAMIDKNLTQGYELLSIKKLPLFSSSLDSLTNVAEYAINLSVQEGRINELLSKPDLWIEKTKKGHIEKVDAKPLILSLKNENGILFLRLRFGPKKTVKPEKIVQLLSGLNDEEVKLVNITRTALFIEKNDGSILEP